MRQRPILNYIVDFVCFELMLIIELDGLTHEFEEVVTKDIQKEKDLIAVGFMVFRFSDWEVLNRMVDINEILTKWLEKRIVKSTLDHLRSKKKGTSCDLSLFILRIIISISLSLFSSFVSSLRAEFRPDILRQ